MSRSANDTGMDTHSHQCVGECHCHHGTEDGNLGEVIRQSITSAIFGQTPARRAVLQLLGTAGALSLIDQILPLGTLEALAEEGGKPEKPELTLGFIGISCSAPLLFAAQQGYFKEAGLDVELVKTPGWGVIRDRLGKGEYDAAHVLSPMPLAMTLGIDSAAADHDLSLIQNTNGQAITLAMKHKDRRNPADWKGLVFGVPFVHSMHNYLLRYYLAEAGLNPDTDVTIRPVAPPEMVAQLKSDTIDAFLSPDPFNQLAVHSGVGFIHMLTKKIWDGHPCCGFSISRKISKEAPNTYLALMRSVIKASATVRKPETRASVASSLSGAAYLNQPSEVLEPIFTGNFSDGVGGTHSEPNRIDFVPAPYPAFGVWILTQMRRWGILAKDVNYQQVAQQVFRMADAEKLLKDAGFALDASGRYTILGKPFDAASPEAYLSSFAIKRT